MRKLIVLTLLILLAACEAPVPARPEAQTADCLTVTVNDGAVIYEGDVCAQTATPEPATSTPVPTDTPEPPTATATLPPPMETSTPTPTATATVTPTVTPEPAGHIDTVWHPLTEEFGHHHGHNPADFIPVFGDVLADYLATYSSLSYPWQTPNENAFKHQGYIWLYDEAAGGCELFNISGNPNCVTHILVQVHSLGTAGAALTRFHSQYAFVRVCDPTLASCGVVATGGWADYGLTHSPYKEAVCNKDADPPGLAVDDDKFQPPYIANPVQFFPNRTLSQFWNSLGPAQNLVNEEYYPGGDLRPNWLLGLAWQSPDAWQVFAIGNCAEPDVAYTPAFDGFPNHNHSRFHVFSVNVSNLPDAPFTGWTNRWGHVVDGCTAAGLDCVPLVVTDGIPTGPAWLNRQVNQGNPDVFSPAQEFDVLCGETTCGWIRFPEVGP